MTIGQVTTLIFNISIQERIQDFARREAWRWKVLWHHFDDVF